MSETQVSVYIRNSKKVGKIVELPPLVATKRLYESAASAHSVPVDSIHLYFAGKQVPLNEDDYFLKQKGIIHLVDISDTQSTSIEVRVRDFSSAANTSNFWVQNTATIKEFIDEKVSCLFGEKPENIVLIYVGKQLPPDRTFQQEDVQTGSEIFCVNIQKIKSASQKQQPQKGVYPSPDLILPKNDEINATSKVDLTYDPHIHHKSCLPDCIIPSSQVISQEQIIKSETPDINEGSQVEQPRMDENEDKRQDVVRESPLIEAQRFSEEKTEEMKNAEIPQKSGELDQS